MFHQQSVRPESEDGSGYVSQEHSSSNVLVAGAEEKLRIVDTSGGRLWAKNAIFQKVKSELINQWHKTAKTHAANWNFLGAMNEQKKVIFFATLPRFLLSLRVNICYHLLGWQEPLETFKQQKTVGA